MTSLLRDCLGPVRSQVGMLAHVSSSPPHYSGKPRSLVGMLAHVSSSPPHYSGKPRSLVGMLAHVSSSPPHYSGKPRSLVGMLAHVSSSPPHYSGKKKEIVVGKPQTNKVVFCSLGGGVPTLSSPITCVPSLSGYELKLYSNLDLAIFLME